MYIKKILNFEVSKLERKISLDVYKNTNPERNSCVLSNFYPERKSCVEYNIGTRLAYNLTQDLAYPWHTANQFH